MAQVAKKPAKNAGKRVVGAAVGAVKMDVTPPDKLKTAEAVKLVPLAQILDDGTNHRLKRPDDEAKINELIGSLRDHGQDNAIVVYDQGPGKPYLLGPGWRRFTAATKLEWTEVKAVIRPFKDERQRKIDRGIENLHRQDLTPIEEMVVAQQFMEAAGTVEEAAKLLGWEESKVRDRLYFARLCDYVKQRVIDGTVPLAHARELAKLGDAEDQKRLCACYCERSEEGVGARPVSQLARHVAEVMRGLKVIPWKLDDPFTGQKGVVGPCAGCPFNSATDANLFERNKTNRPDEGKCMNGGCYERKLELCHKAIDKGAHQMKKDNVTGEQQATKVAQKIAPFVKPSSIARAASKLVKQSEKPKAPQTEKPQETWEDKVRKAEQRYYDAVRKWQDESQKLIEKAAKKVPGNYYRLDIITACIGYPGHSGKLDKLLNLLMDAVFDKDVFGKNIGMLEKALNLRAEWYGFCDDTPRYLDTLATAFGAKLPDMPDKDSFMPKKEILEAAGVAARDFGADAENEV